MPKKSGLGSRAPGARRQARGRPPGQIFRTIIVKRRSYVEKLDDIAAVRAASYEQSQRSPFNRLRRVSQ
ncbi:hypothetical protein NKH60_31530 [Mesorhizobium sp. M1006]|uniref:hypothetical protein n=1 Tax=Mesorhizobium sp. M1006 TaxID=2957048 RepID=UPI00333BD870